MPKTMSRWRQGFVSMAAWLLSTVLLIVDLVVIRGFVMDLFMLVGAIWARINPERWRYARLTFGWVRATADRGLLLILGVAGVVLAIYLEYYYRQQQEKGDISTIARVIALQIVVGLVGWGLSLLMAWGAQGLSP